MATNGIQAQHQLCLPLSEEYCNDKAGIFSFFNHCSYDKHSENSVAYPALEVYLDDLCAFMLKTRLIQRHPDKYFNYVQGESWRQGATHLDGSEVSCEELERTLTMCRGLGALMPTGDLQVLRDLVLQGPDVLSSQLLDSCKEKASAALNGVDEKIFEDLSAFYKETRRLMLYRQIQAPKTMISQTLFQPNADKKMPFDNMQLTSEKQSKILNLVLSHGMNSKKKHEVGIMREAIVGLTTMCSLDSSNHSPVRTVMNIGEGKGYVSRAVSLCDGLQVVGLDCNPQHKENASLRLDNLVELGLSTSNIKQNHSACANYSNSGNCKRELIPSVVSGDENNIHGFVNLLYEPKGYLTSIPCRVSGTVSWKKLLRGHVPLSAYRQSSDDSCAMLIEAGEESCECLSKEDKDEEMKIISGMVAQSYVKGKCKICGQVVRLNGTTAFIMKHIQYHLHPKNAKATNGDCYQINSTSHDLDFMDRPLENIEYSPRQISEWNVNLSVKEYERKLIGVFFTFFSPNQEKGKTLAETIADEGVAFDREKNKLSWCDFYETQYITRGTRIRIMYGEKSEKDKSCRSSPKGKNRSNLSDLSSSSYFYVTAIATVVGFHETTTSHPVVIEKIESLQYSTEEENSASVTSTSIVKLCSFHLVRRCVDCEDVIPTPAELAKANAAVVLQVLPFYQISKYPVSVPLLENTVFAGLHTCGDLGADICRLYTCSASPALLLVSCCWNAVTEKGFPLSNAFKRRNMTTDKIGLLLATQPLDMWTGDSAEGHRSSAKILFFRSLLRLFWVKCADAWEEEVRKSASEPASEQGMNCCSFRPYPSLEPAFLRRVTRDKALLTFPTFCQMVVESYCRTEADRETPYSWHHHVCSSCRERQRTFLNACCAEEGSLACDLSAEYQKIHFPAFLGLTVLRMWMCHLVESVLLLDRTLYLHETLAAQGSCRGDPQTNKSSCVSLVPLFDGAISPRMYGILAHRFSAQ